MIFSTSDGQQYDVDLKQRVLDSPYLAFHKIARVYAGSPGAVFLDEHGEVLLRTGLVVEVEGLPGNRYTLSGFTFSTQNSTYEVDPQHKTIRRLAGLNDPTPSQGPDGEWRTFESIVGLRVGDCALIRYPNDKGTLTSVVRSLTGATDEIDRLDRTHGVLE